MAIADVVVKPMDESFLLWRCLHGGPIGPATIDAVPDDGLCGPVPWGELRRRNPPLLAALTRAYGSCAMLAWDGDVAIGFLRFYPRAVTAMAGAGGLCLQMAHPDGPADGFAASAFPPLTSLTDRTLTVHCLMTGSPSQASNPYQRHGLAGRLVRALAAWGRERGWTAVEATAYEDLDALYQITGQAGRRFWERLGFVVALQDKEPEAGFGDDLLRLIRQQAVAAGLTAADANNRFTVRLPLG